MNPKDGQSEPIAATSAGRATTPVRPTAIEASLVPPCPEGAPLIRFTIDGREAVIAAGGTILQGARTLGIDIPTLCYLERCGAMTSCLVCVVKATLNGRSAIVPSCGVRAVEGMIIESETPEVHELRRSALELLLSDHVGDCLSPCERICPLGMNIPLMLRQVQERRTQDAIATVRGALALPAVLGRLCHRPCENGCRRANCDAAASIGDVERYVAETDQRAERPHLPPCPPPSGRRVAIVGAGPTGLAAAYHLTRRGHACVVFDRQSRPGGSLRGAVETGALPNEILEREIQGLERLGIEFRVGLELGPHLSLPQLQEEFNAVLLAVGELKPGEGEGLGVSVNAAGIRISQPESYLTSVGAVFSAGSAVRPVKQLVKAMAEGQMAAEAILEFLAGRTPTRAPKPFSSVMGRLERSELALFQDGADPGPRQPPTAATGGVYNGDEAARESARCLRCDCRASGHCRLQHYSHVYRAEFGRFPRQRRLFEQHRHPGRVVFEPGKCILCGICVRIATEAAEPLGLTFVGRGFDVRVAAPWNEAFEAGLQKVALECAQACPTGAIESCESGIHSRWSPSGDAVTPQAPSGQLHS